MLKDGLSVITVKFGQGLDFEAHHVLISFKTEIYLPEIFVLLYSLLMSAHYFRFDRYVLNHKFTTPLIPQASDLESTSLWFNTS